MHGQYRFQSKQCNEFQKGYLNNRRKLRYEAKSVEQLIMMNISQINEPQKSLNLLKSQIIQQIDYLIGNTSQWIKSIQEIGQKNANYSFFEQLDNFINQIQVLDVDYRNLVNEINSSNHSWNQKIIKKLKDFQSFELTKRCEELLKNLDAEPFTYDLIQNHSIQQNESCWVIAIIKDNSIVLAGCESKIKVFEFKQEQLKLIQLLIEHVDYVTTLNFMKKSAQFKSGSHDKQIIIWCWDQQSQWVCQYILNEHQAQINCLLLSKNEDLIISGSSDESIKFWTKKNEWTYSQTITDSTNDVVSLSLNEKQNRVISCVYETLFILIIEQQQQDQKWNVIQRLQLMGMVIEYVSLQEQVVFKDRADCYESRFQQM
ncbi:unnamed protein product [Paramecium octaurelia]|uniref:Uncharacterized protein n=1 Tax=Paramecium octaurelia TaxID=43137 RepID=A0A8S1XI27_PAROT|nr:unnamed protein product [Paramecium octaurelia]